MKYGIKTMSDYETADKMNAIEALTEFQIYSTSEDMLEQFHNIVDAVDKISDNKVTEYLKQWKVEAVDKSKSNYQLTLKAYSEHSLDHHEAVSMFVFLDAINKILYSETDDAELAHRVSQGLQHVGLLISMRLDKERMIAMDI